MSIVVVLIILIVMWLLIDVLSIVLKMTGLDLEKSRFQVISMLTHTGFTTRESELIAQHPLRRKIASALMVLSYVTQVTLISLFVNILTQNTQHQIIAMVLLVGAAVIIYILTRVQSVKRWFNRLVERLLSRRLAMQEKQNIEKILKISPGYGVYELLLDDHNALCGKTLEEAKLNQKYIHVLKVDRGGMVFDFPDAGLKLQLGDRLILYGQTSSIKALALPNAA